MKVEPRSHIRLEDEPLSTVSLHKTGPDRFRHQTTDPWPYSTWNIRRGHAAVDGFALGRLAVDGGRRGIGRGRLVKSNKNWVPWPPLPERASQSRRGRCLHTQSTLYSHYSVLLVVFTFQLSTISASFPLWEISGRWRYRAHVRISTPTCLLEQVEAIDVNRILRPTPMTSLNQSNSACSRHEQIRNAGSLPLIYFIFYLWSIDSADQSVVVAKDRRSRSRRVPQRVSSGAFHLRVSYYPLQVPTVHRTCLMFEKVIGTWDITYADIVSIAGCAFTVWSSPRGTLVNA
ncbi:hypothetical protein BDY19DRAFT_490504 [Irpex rosettiformis]|uniref:Uncharacterized protein n=1 Tax=Irpex rosettiformis TaxID=378272 RepID=A0ACB8UES0_9APHY|nr:hypothetical protein BDY19DRAFT_490504 [Irpex rosettiformis]